ncbi:hypothetical protein CBR_g32400 [Chara braunii]|uniref:Major facilitator superfamily (MFS) profile domain-containing protein n=1 Tax=Chara braunii TaxID=69332 RepID=A0A388JYG6_CHABU|nr:hypothetical protein CBR_g32400 [Chara braunii]|eukprot:GBG62817.1 hypothetical protein CBR_g32400 [Chara braunii]
MAMLPDLGRAKGMEGGRGGGEERDLGDGRVKVGRVVIGRGRGGGGGRRVVGRCCGCGAEVFERCRREEEDGQSFRPLKVYFDPMFRMLILVNLAAIMERGDESMLPAVFNELQIRFHASPTALATLTLLRALVQALFSPVAAHLSSRYNRTHVITGGIICWAMATFGVGASVSFSQVATARALNGIGLALVIPSIQSIIADSYPAGRRGWGFGVYQMLGFVGGISGAVFATLMADSLILGVAGWRMAFFVMALASGVLALSMYLGGKDPRDISLHCAICSAGDGREMEMRPLALEEMMSDGSRASSELTVIRHDDVKEMETAMDGLQKTWRDVQCVLRVPTFQVIVAQGVIGSFPISAMVFLTWYFELMGFSHEKVAVLMLAGGVGASIGSVFGGWVGDRMSQIYPDSGRVMCAQFCTGMSAPLSVLLLQGLPRNPHKLGIYTCVMFLSGLLMSWNATATNNPIFAEVVPERLRTTMYAYDRAFEVSFAAFGAPTAGFLSQHLFGFQVNRVQKHGKGPGAAMSNVERQANAAALSKGLVVCLVIPYTICCMVYSLLYRTYPVDRDRVLNETSSQCGADEGGTPCGGVDFQGKEGLFTRNGDMLTREKLDESDLDGYFGGRYDSDALWHLRSIERTREELKLFAVEGCRQ